MHIGRSTQTSNKSMTSFLMYGSEETISLQSLTELKQWQQRHQNWFTCLQNITFTNWQTNKQMDGLVENIKHLPVSLTWHRHCLPVLPGTGIMIVQTRQHTTLILLILVNRRNAHYFRCFNDESNQKWPPILGTMYMMHTHLHHQSVVDWLCPTSEARPVSGSLRTRVSCRYSTACPWWRRGEPTDQDPTPDFVTRLSLGHHREWTSVLQVDVPVLSDPRVGTPHHC